MQNFEIAGHESSLLPEGRWKLVWSDEFDGTELDRTQWDFRTSMMGKKHPAWVNKGVHPDGKGNVVFDLLEEDDRPVSAQLQTGYNFMDEPTVPTKFGGESLQWNIGKLHNNLYTHRYGDYGLDMTRTFAGGMSGVDQKAFHRFGLLWEETGYTFYVDGVENGRITEHVSHIPEFILISTEVKGYREAEHRPVPEAAQWIGKDNFTVDYVRVFDRI